MKLFLDFQGLDFGRPLEPTGFHVCTMELEENAREWQFHIPGMYWDILFL